MSALDGMKRIYPEGRIFVTVQKNTLNFSKDAYELLGSPDRIDIYAGNGKIAVRDGRDFAVSNIGSGGSIMHRVSGAGMVRTVKAEIGDGRVCGDYIGEEGILVFQREEDAACAT